MTEYGIWLKLHLGTLIEKEKTLLSIKHSEFPPMVLDYFKKRIQNIDTKYPWSIKTHEMLFLSITYVPFWIIVLIFFLWFPK